MRKKRNYEEVVGWKRLEQLPSDTGSRCVVLEPAATPSAAAFGSSLKSRLFPQPSLLDLTGLLMW